jgi:hypothetical protein
MAADGVRGQWRTINRTRAAQGIEFNGFIEPLPIWRVNEP